VTAIGLDFAVLRTLEQQALEKGSTILAISSLLKPALMVEEE
jgi:hypothetical protein